MAEANASAVPEPPFSGGLADNLCIQMALIALIGLPGYYLSVCLMDRLGRRFIQLQVAHALGAAWTLPRHSVCTARAPLGSFCTAVSQP